MTKKRGLGKGLDALIPGEEPLDTSGQAIHEVPTSDILPNPRQPRVNLEDAGLEKLAESIRQHGVLQPLLVLPRNANGEYVLVAGERRLEAAKLAGLSSVPVIQRHTDELGQLELALIENLQRTDLNPLEEAEGFRQLGEEFGLSHEEIARQVGKSRTAITNTLRLLKLSATVKRALLANEISEGHARALLALPNAQSQSAALRTIQEQDLSVRATETLVRRLLGDSRKPSKKAKRSPEESDLEDRLRQELGTRVTLRRTKRGGTLVIHFYSDEELNALIDRLLGA